MNAMAAGDDALSPEDKHRFLRALKSDAAFREEVQKEVLTERLLEVPDRMDHLEVRMDHLEVRMDHLEVRMDRLEVRMDRLEVRMDRLEEQMAENARQIAGLTAAVNALIDHQAELRRDVNGLIETTGRIIRIMEAGFTEMREGFAEVRKNFAEVNRRLDRLEGAA